MQTVREITTKNLHDATGTIVRAVRAGQKYRVSIDGGRAAILIPDESAQDASWDEIMAEVWKAQKQPGDVRPNPILEERKRRSYATRLRR